jgi:hypothetical protein
MAHQRKNQKLWKMGVFAALVLLAVALAGISTTATTNMAYAEQTFFGGNSASHPTQPNGHACHLHGRPVGC